MSERRLRLLDDLQAVETYVSVVDAGGITAAARRLGVMPSTVSKKIAELEARAKSRLLHRTTRRMSVTEVGQRFYVQCLRVLEEAERAEWELRDQARDAGGRMRVTAPVVFTERQIAPLLPAFLRRYPRLRLELVATARTVDLIEEGFDLSIRLVRRDRLGRDARVLAENRRVCCASPDYIRSHGEPANPGELAQHRCLIAMTAQRTDMWRFQGKTGIEAVRVGGPLASDNAVTLAQAARQGLGIATLGTFMIGDDLRSGALREILRGFMIQDTVLAAIVPDRGLMPYRVGLFVDYLAEAFGPPPPWDHDLA